MASHNKYGINDQQQSFFDLYRSDPELNATRAYLSAYPKCRSAHSAQVNASKLLLSTVGQKYLATISAEEQTAFGEGQGVRVTVERIIEELKRAAFFDPVNIFDDENQLLSIQEMAPWVRRAIESIKIKKYGTDEDPTYEIIEVKMVSKVRTLELLGRHMVMFTEKFMIESEEAMHERIYAEIRAKGEEAISRALANYARVGEMQHPGKAHTELKTQEEAVDKTSFEYLGSMI